MAVHNLIDIAAGALLAASPWIFGFRSESAASWNAWISGVVIAALAIAALVAFAEWEEWLNLVVGIWVAISPWLVNFSASNDATLVQVAVGAVVAIVAAVRLWFVHYGSPHVTA